MFNNDEWSVGFVNWSYQGQLASDQQKTESDREQDVQYLSKELQHSLLHDLEVSQQSLQEAPLIAEQHEQGF